MYVFQEYFNISIHIILLIGSHFTIIGIYVYSMAQ